MKNKGVVMKTILEAFCSYAHEDEDWRNKLEKHLSSLKREKLITSWYDRKIVPGTEWASEIDSHLNTAQIILLLISPDFIASDYCWGKELKTAMKRHQAGEARVIPVIIRPVDWQRTPFKKLQALPTDGKPVANWPNPDDALLNIAQGIRRAVEDVQKTVIAHRPADTTPARVRKKDTPQQVWTVPFRRNPFFTGREAALAEVHDLLQAGTTEALAQPPAISGLGGIGKTQTAVEYAYRNRVDYQCVLWVQASAQETLLTEFVSLAKHLDLPEQNEQEQQVVVQAVLQWLETHHRWLLIFDNADDLAMVQDYLPQGNQGHILLTTRAQAMAGLARKIELETMDVEEGVVLLLRRAGLLVPGSNLERVSMADREMAQAIVQEMDGLPLALDQAGAYLEETGESLSNYLIIYQQQRADLLKRRGGLRSPHPESVATTWSLALQQVERDQPAAIELMRLCAFLAPDAIPEELLVEGAASLGPVLQPVAANRNTLNEALAALLKYSLLRRDSTTHTLIIHRLVQAVILDELDEQTQRLWAERMVRAVSEVFPWDEPAPWPQSQRYLSQALGCDALIKHFDLILAEAAAVLNCAGWYLKNRGQFQEAESLLQEALTSAETQYGLDDPNTSYLLNNLAALYNKQGKNEEAEAFYQRDLAICEKTLGPEHPDTAITLNNLAEVYREYGKYEEAEPLYQRALAIREKVLGPEHPDTAQTLCNVAFLYYNQGKDEEAEPLYQRSLTIYEKVLGPEHPDTATTLNNLADLYYGQGKYEQAEPLYQRVLAIREKVLGPEHPDTAQTLNDLASLYQVQGKYEQAEPLHQRALAIREKMLGPEHLDTAQTIYNLAVLYHDQRMYEEAEPLYQRALAIYEQLFGDMHPYTANSLNNLAGLYDDQGKYEEAEPLYQRALAFRETNQPRTRAPQ
jgi:tetratricopeptide (TPR) repeat protein